MVDAAEGVWYGRASGGCQIGQAQQSNRMSLRGSASNLPLAVRVWPVVPLHIGYKDVVRLRPDWYLAVHTDRRGVTIWRVQLSGVVFGGAGHPVALHTRLPD